MRTAALAEEVVVKGKAGAQMDTTSCNNPHNAANTTTAVTAGKGGDRAQGRSRNCRQRQKGSRYHPQLDAL